VEHQNDNLTDDATAVLVRWRVHPTDQAT
jgi:hypothetical protein